MSINSSELLPMPKGPLPIVVITPYGMDIRHAKHTQQILPHEIVIQLDDGSYATLDQLIHAYDGTQIDRIA